MTWRVGAVSYLNTKPLIYHLRENLPGCRLVLDLPSRLADQLAQDQLDVALIPSVEYLRGEGLSIVSDAAIACRGPVRSVRLLFRCPPDQVRSLALDEGSRTSAALAQVLLWERYSVRPKCVGLPIDQRYDECPADAVLIIGDRAMRVDERPYVTTWDLGEQWWRDTGLPFVFAMWVARQVDPEVVQALEQSRDAGLEHLDEIVAVEAPKYQLSSGSCYAYFRQQLHFTLGDDERRGLELFRELATSIGLGIGCGHQV